MKQNTNRIIKLTLLLLAVVFILGSFSLQTSAASKEKTLPKVTLKIKNKNMTKKTYSLKKGDTATLKVSVRNMDGKKTITYSSSNKKVATVNAKGVIKAKAAGTAKIKVTVRSQKKTITAWTKIKVTKKSSSTPNQPSGDNQTNILVAYFSCTGTTKPLAEYTAEYLNADLYEIKPKTPYTSEDLDYGNSNSRATKEQNDSSARPAISGTVENMSQYDTIVLAYPIWWGQAPRIISTFLESYDFSGKTIVPFCTSHSSGIGSSDTNLHALVDSSVTWKSGKRFAAGTSKEEMMQWLEKTDVKPFTAGNKKEQTTERAGNSPLESAKRSTFLFKKFLAILSGL